MQPWKQWSNCKVGRTAWSSSCWIQHTRGKRASKLGDGKRAIHDWWGWPQQFLSWACPSHLHAWEWETVEEIFCEPNIEDSELECFAQSDLDPDKFLEQVKTFNEPSLEDPSEENFSQFEDPTPEMRTVNGGTNEISFPNTSSSTAELFIVDNKEVKKEGLTWSKLSTLQIYPMTRKRVLKLTPSSQSLSRHNMNHKFHLFNVSKSHLM